MRCQVRTTKCGPCPVFVIYTLAFALQLSKKHGKTSVRVAEEHPEIKTKTHTQQKKTNAKLLKLRKQNLAPTSGLFHSLFQSCTHVWRVPFIISIRHPRLVCSIHYFNPAPTSGVFQSLFQSCTHVWRVPFIISIRHTRLACSIHYFNPAHTSGMFHSLFQSGTHVWCVPFITSIQHPHLTCSIHYTNPTENSQSARSTNSTCTSTITTVNATSPMNTPPCNTRESQYEYYTKNTTHS